MKQTLFYTIGYPGAGKSTFARSLSRWFGVPHLQADKVGRQLFGVPTFSVAERQAVYQQMDYYAIGRLNAGQHAVYDGTINSLEQREHLRQLARECQAEAIGIWVQVPVDVARDRAARLRDVDEGGRVVPPKLFERHAAAFQAPVAHEAIVQVDGLQPFGPQYRNLYRYLSREGIELPKIIEL